MLEIGGSVAVVTGASRGIGEATARALAETGCHLVLAARTAAGIEALASELAEQFGVRTLPVTTDMSDAAQVDNLMHRAAMEFGRIDILVNNAGIGASGTVRELSDETLERLFAVNLFGPVRAVRAAAPHMPRGACIINVGSIVSFVALPGMGGTPAAGAYCASKFALRAFTTAMRAELRPAGIHVGLAVVGLTATKFTRDALYASEARDDGRSVFANLRFLRVAPQKVANRIVRAVLKRESEFTVSWYDHLLLQPVIHLPGFNDFICRFFMALGSGAGFYKHLRWRDGAVAIGLLSAVRLLLRRRRSRA